MAGVYIKDAELPDACWNCGWDPCVLWKEDRGDLPKHPNCPLVEVPDHGDLIEAHSLKIRFGQRFSLDERRVMEIVRETVDTAKVVIPAERGEE